MATGKDKGSAQKGGSGSSQGHAKRGFAAMDEAQQREIASKGGQAAHQKGTAHEFDSEEARRAGQKGGEAVSRNREHMADIGRKGGESRQASQRAASAAGSGNRSGPASADRSRDCRDRRTTSTGNRCASSQRWRIRT